MHKNFLKWIYRVYKEDSAFTPTGSLGTEVQLDWMTCLLVVMLLVEK